MKTSQSRALPPLLLLWATACPMMSAEDGAIGRDGEIMELVPAEAALVSVPDFVMADERLTATVAGIHPDPCTRFDRFESQAWAREGGVVVSAWAARPVGTCPGDGDIWEEALTISGLPAGQRAVGIGGLEESRPTVLAGRRADCLQPERIEVRDLRAPGATYEGGSLSITAEVTHPTPCHGPPEMSHEILEGRLHLLAHARPCGPVEDAEACPRWSRPMEVSYELGPLDLGEGTLFFDQTDVPFSVVDASECVFEPIAADYVHAPRLIPDGRPARVSIAGRLPSPCADLDSITWTAGDGELNVELFARDCEGACEAVGGGPSIEMQASLEDLPPGSWRLTAGGMRLEREVFVAPPGACLERSLPGEAVSSVLVTSGLYTDVLSDGAALGRPLDVHMVGSLPDGCWTGLRLEEIDPADEVGGRIELRTRVKWCDLDCDLSEDGEPNLQSFRGGGDDESAPPEDGPGDDEEHGPITTSAEGRRAFSTGWSRPSGLPEGRHELTIDGRGYGSIVVQ